MRSSRISQALFGDVLALPANGVVAVIGPSARDDFSALPRDRVEIVQGFRPDHDHFAAQGYAVRPEIGGPYAAAVICLPRARAEGEAMIAAAAAAVAPGGPILIDGQKTDGIDTMLRSCRARAPIIAGPIAQAHGKIFALRADAAAFADWAAAPSVTDEGFHTAPGVFSADGPDPGSVLLAAHLPEGIAGRLADLGAGWGFLSTAILTHPRVTECHLVEASHAALDCARMNVTDPRARFHWADATAMAASLPAADRFDWVITNPPFHGPSMGGRGADPQIGIRFIRAAARMLRASGTCLIVANRHLPYERAMIETFAQVETVVDEAGYKILCAARPRDARAAPARGAPTGRRPAGGRRRI